MCNFKALGIDKEMSQFYENTRMEDLQKLQKSEYFFAPLITRRQSGQEYCNVRVIGCRNDSWWYKELDGLEFFCEIRYRYFNGKKSISDYVGVILTNTKVITLRGFDPADVMII